MQGKHTHQPKLFFSITLDSLVPADNFYRKVQATVDFRFLYKQTKVYYGSEGNPSIDPVVFFKLLLVGYLNNITSDRRLVQFASNCLDIRLFLGYELDEPLPWHSTLSRTRALLGEEVFLSLFKSILSVCIQQGMVNGARQAVDSAFVKANASMDSLQEKSILDDAIVWTQQFDQDSDFSVPQDKKTPLHLEEKTKEQEQEKAENRASKQGKTDAFKLNSQYYSPTDPDAKISYKPGKLRQLHYYAQVSVDDAHHVICGAGADLADQRDSQCMKAIVEQTLQNLAENDCSVSQILADSNYASGESLAYLEEQNLDAWIPVSKAHYNPQREGFVYHQDLNEYECVQEGGNGAILTYKKQRNKLRANGKPDTRLLYRSQPKDCKNCPLKLACCGEKNASKAIEDSIDKDYYRRMHQKLTQQPAQARRMRTIRSKTVEPVLGTLLTFMGMKRVGARGLTSAHKHVLMASMAYNLKKLMKWLSKPVKKRAQSQEYAHHEPKSLSFVRFWRNWVGCNDFSFCTKLYQPFFRWSV